MVQTFFATPFATSGDTTAIPTTVQGDGSVSFPQGYGPDYEENPATPGVLYPERPKMNYLFNVITGAINIIQVHGFPDFITSSANGGSPYSYDINSYVRYTDGNVYVSLVNSNTALPTDATKWGLFNPFPGAFQTGDTMIWEDTTLRTGGWVWSNGTTVGDASSNATGRANADTAALFAQIWRVFPNSVRPIVNSDGSPGTRGASAAADYAAHKALPVRDMRCVVPAGTSTMGGIAARTDYPLNGYRQGVDASTFGNTGGEQAHTQASDELVPHLHSVPYGGGNAVPGGPNRSGDPSGQLTALQKSTSNTGGGAAANVVQPTTICNYITKL